MEYATASVATHPAQGRGRNWWRHQTIAVYGKAQADYVQGRCTTTLVGAGIKLQRVTAGQVQLQLRGRCDDGR